MNANVAIILLSSIFAGITGHGRGEKPAFKAGDCVQKSSDPSRHNSKRHGQVERARKLRKRAGRKPNKPYYKEF